MAKWFEGRLNFAEDVRAVSPIFRYGVKYEFYNYRTETYYTQLQSVRMKGYYHWLNAVKQYGELHQAEKVTFEQAKEAVRAAKADFRTYAKEFEEKTGREMTAAEISEWWTEHFWSPPE